MILIETGNSSGTTGRCDAKCYNATGPECDCVCGGRNHGVGIKQALQNTEEILEKEYPELKDQLEHVRSIGLNPYAYGKQLSIFDAA